MSLLGQDALEALAAPALEAGGGDAVEVVVQRSAGGLTRFANSQIHQNAWSEDLLVNVRLVTPDQRVGVAGVHTDQPSVVAAAVERARAAALRSPPDGEFPGLAGSAPSESTPFDERTAATTPAERAAEVRALLAEVPADMEAAGAYETLGTELLVATTAGQRAYAPASYAHLTLVVSAPTSSGFAEEGGRRRDEIDAAAAGRRAVAKARLGADPVDVEAGDWPVVLEPPAVATLVEFLAYLGFGGRDYLEGRSFVCGHLGERMLDPAITVVDDGRAHETVGMPFDYEGTPKQRVALVDRGVLHAVVHDRHSARQGGVTSTGHGMMAPNPHGPITTNAFLLPGPDGSTDDLVAGMGSGLLVTRFHYTNDVHPLETTITGMTRDGTFLVRDGEIVAAVRNLRFTQSIVAALGRVEAVSSETGYGSEFFLGGRNPSVRLPAFTFTGTTSFG